MLNQRPDTNHLKLVSEVCEVTFVTVSAFPLKRSAYMTGRPSVTTNGFLGFKKCFKLSSCCFKLNKTICQEYKAQYSHWMFFFSSDLKIYDFIVTIVSGR